MSDKGRAAARIGSKAIRPPVRISEFGIPAGGKSCETKAPARAQQRERPMQDSNGSALSRSIAIEAEDRLGCEAPKLMQLEFGQRGSERRHSGRETRPMQSDHVHIAFGDDYPGSADAASRERPPAPLPSRTAFAPYRRAGFRRIQIFRLSITDHTAAKGDHPAASIADRKHHSVSEIIDRLSRVRAQGAAQEPGFNQQRLGKIPERLRRSACLSSGAQPKRKRRIVSESRPRSAR